VAVEAADERTVTGSPARPRPGPIRWLPVLLGVAVAGFAGALTRFGGPALFDPDEYAAALYFDRIVHHQRLETILHSTPKPLLTLVHGISWQAFHTWLPGGALTIAAFAVAVVTLARAAARVSGPTAAVLVVLALAGSTPLLIQVARGNSMIWGIAWLGVAADALAGRAPPDRRWGVAAAALLLAGLSRSEAWMLLPFAAVHGLLAWRRGQRQGLLLLLPLAAPALWFAHDWLLAGDPAYSARMPERYTAAFAGFHPIPYRQWLAVFRHHHVRWWLDLLALAGVAWLAARRAWVLLAGLAVLFAGVWLELAWYANQGIYISPRYFILPDATVTLAAAFGAAGPFDLLAAGSRRPPARPPWRWPAGWPRRGLRLAGVVAAALLLVAAIKPLAPADPTLKGTLDDDTARARRAIVAIQTLRPLVREPDAVILTTSGLRNRIMAELGMRVDRVLDLALVPKGPPGSRWLAPALAGASAVVDDGDPRYAALEINAPTRIGAVRLVPIRVDPALRLWILRVDRDAGAARR
jgi:hypothetical protein